VVDLTPIFRHWCKLIKLDDNETQISHQVSLGNLKARLRMICLYFFANHLQYLVVGTSNRDEWYLGYFTKFGDGACDLAPLLQLSKDEVRIVAQELTISSEIVNQPPSADLWIGQTDELELGFTYSFFDQMFLNIFNNQKDLNFKTLPKKDQNRIQKIINLHYNTKHKRRLAAKPKKHFNMK
jgi:NAD+ synthase